MSVAIQKDDQSTNKLTNNPSNIYAICGESTKTDEQTSKFNKNDCEKNVPGVAKPF